MIITEDTTRWVRASINKWFDSKKGPFPIRAENQETNQFSMPTAWNAMTDAQWNSFTEDEWNGLIEQNLKANSAYAEIRMNGPRIYEQLRDQGEIQIDIQVLCSATLTADLYLIDRIVGVFQVACTTIPVFKYGDRPNDDQSQLGCLILRSDVARPIDTIQWGQLDTTTRMTQTSIESFYKLAL